MRGGRKKERESRGRGRRELEEEGVIGKEREVRRKEQRKGRRNEGRKERKNCGPVLTRNTHRRTHGRTLTMSQAVTPPPPSVLW
jgi:hypothetical protein